MRKNAVSLVDVSCKNALLFVFICLVTGCAEYRLAETVKIGTNRYQINAAPGWGPAEGIFDTGAKKVCPKGYNVVERYKNPNNGNVIGTIQCEQK